MEPTKAAVCNAFGEPLRIEEIVPAPPEAGEVRVRLKATAICHSDTHALDGAGGGVLPVVYGHEAAGVAVQVPIVDLAQRGQRILGGKMGSAR